MNEKKVRRPLPRISRIFGQWMGDLPPDFAPTRFCCWQPVQDLYNDLGLASEAVELIQVVGLALCPVVVHTNGSQNGLNITETFLIKE